MDEGTQEQENEKVTAFYLPVNSPIFAPDYRDVGLRVVCVPRNRIKHLTRGEVEDLARKAAPEGYTLTKLEGLS